MKILKLFLLTLLFSTLAHSIGLGRKHCNVYLQKNGIIVRKNQTQGPAVVTFLGKMKGDNLSLAELKQVQLSYGALEVKGGDGPYIIQSYALIIDPQDNKRTAAWISFSTGKVYAEEFKVVKAGEYISFMDVVAKNAKREVIKLEGPSFTVTE